MLRYVRFIQFNLNQTDSIELLLLVVVAVVVGDDWTDQCPNTLYNLIICMRLFDSFFVESV